MAEAKTKKTLISHGVAAQNRKARFDYAIKDTVEAGLVLKGPEVKSLRHGRATLSEAWAGEREGELWLFNAYIPEYQGPAEPRARVRACEAQADPLVGRCGGGEASRWCRCRSISPKSRVRPRCWGFGLGEGRKKHDSAPRSPARLAVARQAARRMRARG
jgi:SsrA-binding protein